MEISRRRMLQFGGLSALAVGGLAVPLGGSVTAKSASLLDEELLPRPYRTPFTIPPVIAPIESGEDEFGKYDSYVINQRATTAQLLPSGVATPMWGYQALVPGPTIHVETGTRVVAKVRNRLPEVHPMFGHPFATSTHLHGNASLPQYDGYASDLTRPGHSKVYQWPNGYQQARTLWYHDHASHVTAENVYGGLAGQYHVHDAFEREMMPTRPFDVPLTVRDVMFAKDGSLHYDDRDHSGVWGDVILVNGRPWPHMKVLPRVYRFRLLNASVSRSYRFVMYPETPFHMVATDGGFMPQTQEVMQWRSGPAERYEFLIDFSKFAPGQQVELRNLSNENNRDFDHTDKIMRFEVVDGVVDKNDPTWNRIPTTLRPHPAMDLRREMATKKRYMRMRKSDITNEWSINERTWADVIESGFTEVLANPGLDDVEVWTIESRSGGWFHPVHIHLVDFQILSRNGKPPFPYELGPKDVVYVGEGDVIDVIMRFGPHRGKYMIHCHNLSHEDHDMMIQYSVGLVKGEPDPNDPITADPPRFDTDGDLDVPPDPTPPMTEPGDPEPDPDPEPEPEPDPDHDDDPGHDDDHHHDDDPAPGTPSQTAVPKPKPTRKPRPRPEPTKTRKPKPKRKPRRKKDDDDRKRRRRDRKRDSDRDRKRDRDRDRRRRNRRDRDRDRRKRR